MASNGSEMLGSELQTDLWHARRLAQVGETLAAQRYNIALLDTHGAGVDPMVMDHDEWTRLQAEVAERENYFIETAQEVTQALGDGGKLTAPSGLVFAIWSATHSGLQSYNRIGGQWRAMPIGLRTDDRRYPDDFLPGVEVPPARLIAVTASVIRNDLNHTQTPGAVYAYTSDAETRYHISDPAYNVDLLPEPEPGKFLLRSTTDTQWVQVPFE
jgi:hypothetical protein